MFNRQLISAIAMVVGLSGCGSDSDTAVSTPLVLFDGFVTVVPEQNSFVNLRPFVLAGASAELELTDISLVSGSDSGCSDSPVVSELGVLGFETTLNGSALCKYSYSVVSASLGSKEVVEKTASINVFATTSENPVLKPISVALELTEPTSKKTVYIDKALEAAGDTWPSGYTLSDNVTLFGEGVLSSDATTRTITFTPTKIGSNRIVYRLVDGEGSAHKYGTIEISVLDSDNNAPIASNDGEWKDEVKLNTLTDIDIAEFVKSPDGEALHLIDVNALSADVKIKATESSSNTIFTFMSNVSGEHYVSYVVGDNNGLFDTGIVKVIVEERDIKATWVDDLAGGLIFTAPLTKSESDTLGAGATAGFFDGVNTPAVLISSWTFDEAKSYCHSPMSIPTMEELDTLKLSSIRNEVAKWPKDLAYWTKDGGMYNLSSDVVVTRHATPLSDSGTRGYVTCANSVGSLEVSTSDPKEVLADGEDTGVIEARIINREGEPYPGIEVQVTSISGEGVVTPDTEEVTDENGIVKFFVTSLEVGIQQFVIRVEDAGVEKIADITFRKKVTDISFSTSIKYLLVNDSKKLSATEVYEDSTTSPLINGHWTLTSEIGGSASEFSLTQNGTFFSGVAGYFGVTVEKDGVNSSELPVRVCVTTAGECLDVVDVNDTGKLYTSTPSVPWLDSVDLSDLADGKEVPRGGEPDKIWYGPEDSEYYIFDWTSAFSLCIAYNDIALEGRTNWRLPYLDELRVELLNGEVKRDMYDSRTWPTWSQYWTSTFVADASDGKSQYSVIATDGDQKVSPAVKWNKLYVSCTSDPI
ncbi:Ig-like domain-containing protein [Vibrio lentus]|uniref:Ig-like domain-containing protein n=1 Tax=Vibrio lentus TaxID=136468 RepID=UPI00178CE91E|nr:hypothetical protein [Vibrio lentus]MDN3628303.1 hypothetical protein [Vibrio lentus]